MGRPESIGILDEALKYVLSHDDVWVTTAGEIADFYMANCYDKVLGYLRSRVG